MANHPPTSNTLADPSSLGRDDTADYPGVNTGLGEPGEAPIGSAAGAAGVGHPTLSGTEAQRGTSGQVVP